MATLHHFLWGSPGRSARRAQAHTLMPDAASTLSALYTYARLLAVRTCLQLVNGRYNEHAQRTRQVSRSRASLRAIKRNCASPMICLSRWMGPRCLTTAGHIHMHAS